MHIEKGAFSGASSCPFASKPLSKHRGIPLRYKFERPSQPHCPYASSSTSQGITEVYHLVASLRPNYFTKMDLDYESFAPSSEEEHAMKGGLHLVAYGLLYEAWARRDTWNKYRAIMPHMLKIITLRDKRLVKRMVEPIKSITFAPAFMHKTIL